MNHISAIRFAALLSCCIAFWAQDVSAEIASGDRVLTIEDAQLMDEDRVLAKISQGTELLVQRTEGLWCLVSVDVDDEETLGWVAATQLTLMPSSHERLWLISTRGSSNREGRFHHWVLGADNQFHLSCADAFAQTDNAEVPTIFFLHGNRTSRQWAVRDGWHLYRFCKTNAGGRAFRYVIWSWPSDRIGRRNRPDVQIKACRADEQSLYLAMCLEGISGDVPLSLVGHSFGARAISGALHILGGGSVASRTLAHIPEPRTAPIRVALVAAAMNSDWLSPGHRNGNALNQVERVLVTRNSRDNALKWYTHLYRLHGPAALGFVGATGFNQLQGAKLETVSLTCQVGREHRWAAYFASSSLQNTLERYTFCEQDGGEPVVKLPTTVSLAAADPAIR